MATEPVAGFPLLNRAQTLALLLDEAYTALTKEEERKVITHFEIADNKLTLDVQSRHSLKTDDGHDRFDFSKLNKCALCVSKKLGSFFGAAVMRVSEQYASVIPLLQDTDDAYDTGKLELLLEQLVQAHVQVSTELNHVQDCTNAYRTIKESFFENTTDELDDTFYQLGLCNAPVDMRISFGLLGEAECAALMEFLFRFAIRPVAPVLKLAERDTLGETNADFLNYAILAFPCGAGHCFPSLHLSPILDLGNFYVCGIYDAGAEKYQKRILFTTDASLLPMTADGAREMQLRHSAVPNPEKLLGYVISNRADDIGNAMYTFRGLYLRLTRDAPGPCLTLNVQRVCVFEPASITAISQAAWGELFESETKARPSKKHK
jgi:hypothetical protein